MQNDAGERQRPTMSRRHHRFIIGGFISIGRYLAANRRRAAFILIIRRSIVATPQDEFQALHEYDVELHRMRRPVNDDFGRWADAATHKSL